MRRASHPLLWTLAVIVAIAAATFFVYSHELTVKGTLGADNSGPLVAVIVLGLLGWRAGRSRRARRAAGATR